VSDGTGNRWADGATPAYLCDPFETACGLGRGHQVTCSPWTGFRGIGVYGFEYLLGEQQRCAASSRQVLTPFDTEDELCFSGSCS
jgi:hypothetical protein